jgi:phosphoheptose isomerase
MDMRNSIKDWIQESVQVMMSINGDPRLRKQIEIACAILIRAILDGHTVFACGNGGSSSDSAHFVAELMNRFHRDRDYPLPAIDLSASNSTITAIANDYSFEEVFSKQLRGLGKKGDMLVAISTSGKSPNVLRAIETAHSLGMLTIFLTAQGVNVNLDSVQHVNVPSNNTPIIQEAHITIVHILCHQLDRHLIGDPHELD